MTDYIHPTELSLFTEPTTIQGIEKIKYVDYRPVAQLKDSSAIEFHIPGAGNHYVDLKNTKLHVALRLLKPDSMPINSEDSVGLVAVPMHSLFSQIDLYLNQENVTPSSTLYPYKAYAEKLLTTCTTRNHPQSKAELHILDGSWVEGASSNFATSDPNEAHPLHNEGLYLRSQFTALGRKVELEAPLHLDLAQADRYILHAVDIRLKLYPTQNAFRLMTASGQQYQVEIVDAFLKVCKVQVSPEIILAHNTVLETKKALYPYTKTDLKTYTVPEGQYTANIENPYQGIVPNKLFVFFVQSAAFNGDYSLNPYNLRHYDIRSAGFYLDGISVPNQPLDMHFNYREVVTAYNALVEASNKNDPQSEFDISITKFMDGFCILAFDLSNAMDVWPKPHTGHTRLELRFGVPLPHAINVVLMAQYPQTITIDKARNVSTQ